MLCAHSRVVVLQIVSASRGWKVGKKKRNGCVDVETGNTQVQFHFSPFYLDFVHHPQQDVAPHQCLPLSSVAFLFQVFPSFLAMSFRHLPLGRPLDLSPLLDCYSVQRLVHLSSFIFAICPARLHFCSITFVFFLISERGILSCGFRINIFLSIALLAVLSLSIVHGETLFGSHRTLLALSYLPPSLCVCVCVCV